MTALVTMVATYAIGWTIGRAVRTWQEGRREDAAIERRLGVAVKGAAETIDELRAENEHLRRQLADHRGPYR